MRGQRPCSAGRRAGWGRPRIVLQHRAAPTSPLADIGLRLRLVIPWITSSLLLKQLEDFDDHSAWNLLAGHFREPIVSLARRRGLDAAQAEDAAQETLLAFARAYRDGKYERSKGRLKDWLFGIAYRQISNTLRQSVRTFGGASPIETCGELADEDDCNEVWDTAWRRAILARCVDQARAEVQEKTFLAFQLVAVQRSSAVQVAKELGMTRAQVYDAKYRVSRRIRELASEYEDA